MKKKFLFLAISIILGAVCFAQASENPLKGEWSKDGEFSSDYHLVITDSNITFKGSFAGMTGILGMGERYRKYKYNTWGNYIIVDELVDYTSKNLTADWYDAVVNNKYVSFTRDGDYLTFHFEKGDIKYILTSAKHAKYAENAKEIAVTTGEVAAVAGGAVYVVHEGLEAWKINEIAEKAYQATKDLD